VHLEFPARITSLAGDCDGRRTALLCLRWRAIVPVESAWGRTRVEARLQARTTSSFSKAEAARPQSTLSPPAQARLPTPPHAHPANAPRSRVGAQRQRGLACFSFSASPSTAHPNPT